VKACIFHQNHTYEPHLWHGVSLNRGMFFGESPFTTLKLIAGKFQAMSHHFKRLEKSLEFLFNAEFKVYRPSIENALNKLHETEGEYYFRITFTKTLNDEIDFFIYKLPYENVEGDLFLEKSNVIKGRTNIPNFLKVGNYLEYTLELKERSEFNEFVYFNHEEHLLECGTSNIFLLQNGVVLTPALIPGILDGVTRSLLLEFLREENIAVNETTLFEKDLLTSSEIWLTNSMKGFRAIKKYSNKEYSNEVCSKIQAGFSHFVSEYE
jgi:branched-chain amino acid aminotransferase